MHNIMKIMKLIPIVAVLFGITSIVYLLSIDQKSAILATQEDGIIENLSALFYFFGIIFSILAVIKVRPKSTAVVWLLLCVLFLGEETSWFQRYFGYSVPFVEDLNAQKEFNIHNFYLLQGGKIADPSGDFSIKMLFKSQNLFRIGFLGYFLLLPILFRFTRLRDSMLKLGYRAPPTAFTMAVLVVVLPTFIAAVFAPTPEIKAVIAETREMIYAFFIMTYIAVYILYRNVVPFGK